MDNELLYQLIHDTENYRNECIKSYESLDLMGMLESFYLWVLAHMARNPETFNCKAESWWAQKAEQLFNLMTDGQFIQRLEEMRASIMELQEAGISIDPYVNIFPNLEWDMDFVTEDCHALAIETMRFNEEYSPETRRIVLSKAVLYPVREQLEEFAYVQTPLTYVYWWAAWFYSDKEDCLKQIWWDAFKECMKRENIAGTLDRISKLTAKENGRYLYGLDRSIYEDGKSFPFPEYPLDLAGRYSEIFI